MLNPSPGDLGEETAPLFKWLNGAAEALTKQYATGYAQSTSVARTDYDEAVTFHKDLHAAAEILRRQAQEKQINLQVLHGACDIGTHPDVREKLDNELKSTYNYRPRYEQESGPSSKPAPPASSTPRPNSSCSTLVELDGAFGNDASADVDVAEFYHPKEIAQDMEGNTGDSSKGFSKKEYHPGYATLPDGTNVPRGFHASHLIPSYYGREPGATDLSDLQCRACQKSGDARDERHPESAEVSSTSPRRALSNMGSKAHAWLREKKNAVRQGRSRRKISK